MEAPATQKNLDAFCDALADQYHDLFANDPGYVYSARMTTPEALARKMTLGLENGQASKDGKGIVAVCKQFGIKHTYKAIREFLAAE